MLRKPGQAAKRDVAAASGVVSCHPPAPTIEATPIEWDIEVSLLNNQPILRGLILVSGISGLLMAALLSFIFAVSGEWRHIPAILGLASLATGVVFLLMVFASLLFYGNHMHMAFRLDTTGLECAVIDRRARTASVLALTVGAVAGRPGLVGSGLIAAASSRQQTQWASIASARFNPRRHTVSLANDWRTVVILFCTPANFEAVCARIRTELARRTIRPRISPHPLLRLCLWSFLAAVACIPLLRLEELLDTGLFAALCVLLFALASIWLVPLLAWVVLGCIGWLCLLVTLALSYRVIDSNDWANLALAGTGALYLVIFSMYVLKGRIRTGLE